MMIVKMNLIKFAIKTIEEGGAYFSLPLGTDCPNGLLDIDDSTTFVENYTNLQSVKHHVRSYVYNHIDKLVDHDNYLCSLTSGDKLYLYISKLKL